MTTPDSSAQLEAEALARAIDDADAAAGREEFEAVPPFTERPEGEPDLGERMEQHRLAAISAFLSRHDQHRDTEWWGALCMVDSVASTPEAVKKWVMAEHELEVAVLREGVKLAEQALRDEIVRFHALLQSALGCINPEDWPGVVDAINAELQQCNDGIGPCAYPAGGEPKG